MWRQLSDGLDIVYKWAAYGAGALLVTLCSMIMYSIIARLMNLYIGGVNDFAGYIMATSTFMAMAYTFRSNGHIRVGLLIQRYSGSTRRNLETIVLMIMSAVTWFLAFYMIRLTYYSYIYHERSEGVDATLLWIPQTPVAMGSVLMAVAVTHTLLQAVFDYDAINPEAHQGEGVNEV